MIATQQLWDGPGRQVLRCQGTALRAGTSAAVQAPRRRGRWILLLGVALPVAHAAGQARTHLVRGQVVDLVTGAPLAEAQVFVLGIQRPAVTDAAGYFRHTGLAPLSYLLQVRKAGYVVMTWEVMAVDDSSVVHLLELHPLQMGGGERAQASGRPGSAVVRGRVLEQATEAPIPGAEVFVLGRPEPTTTDAAGYFRHPGLAATPHVVQVRKIGYEPATVQVAAEEDSTFVHVFELQRSDVPTMDTLVVQGTPAEPTSYWHADFERRRAAGRGQFVTRREIEQRDAASLGDLLRTLNGLRMDCTTRGCTVRMTRTNCRPEYFADGFPADATTVERMPVNDVFGVEVYDLFEVPIGLQRPELRCGVIAVWTRRGPPPRR